MGNVSLQQRLPVAVILCRPEISRNIGAVCRSMANNNCADLRIVGNKNDYDEDSSVITLNRYSKTKMCIRKKETGSKEYGIYYYKIKDGNTMLRVKWQIDSSDAISIIEVCLVSVKNKKLRMIYPNEKDE